MLLACSIACATAESQERISGKRNDKLIAEDKDKTVKAEASIVKMSRYMRDCKAAGVPLPPVWGGGGWQNVGSLPKEKSFDSPGNPVTEVWTYTSDLGICYALPRLDAERANGGAIQLLGIICQGRESSKACFWDNIDASTGARIIGAKTDGMDPADIHDGYRLDENCTECHRGENVFNIYPGTALDQKNTEVARAPYSPIGQSAWANPKSDYKLPSGNCATCHDLPQLTPGYCGVLKGVIETGIMPLTDGLTPTPDFRTDVVFLAERCNALEPKLKWVFDEAAQRKLGYLK